MPQEATGFEHTYPNIARWVQSYGWIEMGDDGQSPSDTVGEPSSWFLLAFIKILESSAYNEHLMGQ
jgi:hypothetical protein